MRLDTWLDATWWRKSDEGLDSIRLVNEKLDKGQGLGDDRQKEQMKVQRQLYITLQSNKVVRVDRGKSKK